MVKFLKNRRHRRNRKECLEFFYIASFYPGGHACLPYEAFGGKLSGKNHLLERLQVVRSCSLSVDRYMI